MLSAGFRSSVGHAQRPVVIHRISFVDKTKFIKMRAGIPLPYLLEDGDVSFVSISLFSNSCLHAREAIIKKRA
jgi:hypothetical protein